MRDHGGRVILWGTCEDVTLSSLCDWDGGAIGDRVSIALTSILAMVLSPNSSVRVLTSFVPPLVASHCYGRGAVQGFRPLGVL